MSTVPARVGSAQTSPAGLLQGATALPWSEGHGKAVWVLASVSPVPHEPSSWGRRGD